MVEFCNVGSLKNVKFAFCLNIFSMNIINFLYNFISEHMNISYEI